MLAILLKTKRHSIFIWAFSTCFLPIFVHSGNYLTKFIGLYWPYHLCSILEL